MTRIYHIQKKAADLKLGDLFVDWAFPKEDPPIYSEANRILNIKEKNDHLIIVLDDGRKFNMHPGHLAVVEVMA